MDKPVNLPSRIVAQSAGKSDDWPYWYVSAEGSTINITPSIMQALLVAVASTTADAFRGPVLMTREQAKWLEATWNG